MKFKDIEEFSNKLPYPHILAPEDKEWCFEEGEVYWANSYTLGFEVYSAYLPEGYQRQEDYFICNGDTQQGYWQTFVFPLSKEITWEDFEEKYKDYM
jgi:hypothetical protein